MLRGLIAVAAMGAGALLLGSCATMSEDQCLAGDWGGQGFRDGANGLSMSRLEDHAKACEKHGVAPDEVVYRSARADGLTRYCTVERGFVEGREGNGYANVCPADLEADFLPAYRDGQFVHAAESALESAISSVDSYGARLEELDDKIDAKRRECRDENLAQAERDRACERVGELRREREDTGRNWRQAQDEVDDAERDVRDVRYRFQAIYGGW
ncbi:MAG: DUF2799 domain-containing protein [Brevundimonas sp.]|nr:MAG: DUF2799 domain-containing protein [Brevundimonas sp.]